MRPALRAACVAVLAAVAACRSPRIAVAPSPPQPRFDVPRLDRVAIDGTPDDWGRSGFRIDVLASPSAPRQPTADFDAMARLGWDARGLLVFVAVTDDAAAEHADASALWRADSVELFVATARGGADVWQAIVAPGIDPKHPELRSHLCDYRKTEALKATALAIQAARTKTADGYTLEALLPWANLGIEPQVGREIGFQLYVNDADGPGDRAQLRWHPEANAHRNTRHMQRVRLAERPGTPVWAVASGGYERFRRTRIRVAAARGAAARVFDGGRLFGEGRLEADGRLRTGDVVLPMPPRGKPYGTLAVAIDGARAAAVTLPDAEPMRKQAFERAELTSGPCVFSGEAFPPVEFEHPSLVEDIIGLYTLKATFYDAAYNQVAVAKKPGRYGAIVTIQPEDGEPTKRFLTLFRQPEGIRWWHARLPLTVELPRQLGIDPAVAREQAETLADFLKWQMVAGFHRDADAAVVLAGLHETKPGTPPTERTGPRARNNWWWHGLKRRTGDLVPLRSFVHLPPGAEKPGGKRWPTILFLHGAGERGDDLKLVEIHGPPKLVKTRRDFPFIGIAPQCPRRSWWTAPLLDDLFREMLAKYPIDPDRVYLTGLSMGGYGSWALACEYPGRFAAVVPICGGGDPRDVARLKDIPIWVFHGGKDGVVPVARSEAMVAALRKVGGRVRFTVYPEASHNSWAAAYADPKLYEWLLAQRRGHPAQPRATVQGTQPSH